MKLKIYKPVIFLILLFHVIFINFPYIDGYGVIQYLLLVVVGVFLLTRFKVFKRNPFKKINSCMFLYLALVLLSGYMNRGLNIERQVLMTAILFSVKVVEVFFMFELFAINGKQKQLISTLFILTAFYCVISDIVLLVKPTLHIQEGMYYLIGNKFELSYLHLQMIVLYLQMKKNMRIGIISRKISENIAFISLSILSLFICLQIDCSTGVMGIVLLIIFYYLNIDKKKIFGKPIIFLVVLLISCGVLLLFSNIITFEPVRYLVEDVLHKDITLTGRMQIYSSLDTIFNGHLLFGYGLGSSFEVVMHIIGAPNTQNGLLEIILEQGIFSLALLMILIYKVFKYESKSIESNYLVLMIYLYAVFASIEITLSLSFITWLALFLVSKYQKGEYVRISTKKEGLDGEFYS